MNFELAAGFERYRAPVAYDWLTLWMNERDVSFSQLWPMQGILSSQTALPDPGDVAQLARTYADILIAELMPE